MAKDDDSFLDVDLHLLDENWMGQPLLFSHWAKKLAKAKKDLDVAEAELDLVEAELGKAIRRRPEKYGLLKDTDKPVAAAILMQPRYKEAKMVVIEAKYKVAMIQAAVTALDHRKKALEKLVDLHGQNYFSKPKAPKHAKEAMNEMEKRATRSKYGGKDG